MDERRLDTSAAGRWRRALGFAIVGAVIAMMFAGLIWAFGRYGWYAAIFILLIPLYYPPLTIALFPGVWRRRNEPPPPAASDLARRRLVWRALSELYLDTELDDGDFVRIASQLQESGYPADQLEEILYREIHPVLHLNLISVAGEWAAFDMEWAEEVILERERRRDAKKARRKMGQSRGRLALGFAFVPGKRMVRESWDEVARRLSEAPRALD